MTIIDKVAAIIQDAHGRVLLVRVGYTDIPTFIAPGGRRQDGESDEATLRRELREELGVELIRADPFGTFTDEAALHPGRQVRMAVYHAFISGTPTPQGEITELLWADTTTTEPVGTIMRDHVIPAVTRKDTSG